MSSARREATEVTTLQPAECLFLSGGPIRPRTAHDFVSKPESGRSLAVCDRLATSGIGREAPILHRLVASLLLLPIRDVYSGSLWLCTRSTSCGT